MKITIQSIKTMFFFSFTGCLALAATPQAAQMKKKSYNPNQTIIKIQDKIKQAQEKNLPISNHRHNEVLPKAIITIVYHTITSNKPQNIKNKIFFILATYNNTNTIANINFQNSICSKNNNPLHDELVRATVGTEVAEYVSELFGIDTKYGHEASADVIIRLFTGT